MIPQFASQNFTHAGFRQFLNPCDFARDLVGCQVLAAMGDNIFFAYIGSGFQNYEQAHGFAGLVVWDDGTGIAQEPVKVTNAPIRLLG